MSGSKDCIVIVWELFPEGENDPVNPIPDKILYGHDDCVNCISVHPVRFQNNLTHYFPFTDFYTMAMVVVGAGPDCEWVGRWNDHLTFPAGGSLSALHSHRKQQQYLRHRGCQLAQ